MYGIDKLIVISIENSKFSLESGVNIDKKTQSSHNPIKIILIKSKFPRVFSKWILSKIKECPEHFALLLNILY